jgi:hypothetical protein
MAPYALFAHELAHVLFMDHFQNAKGLLFDHDHADRNCAMSYPLIEIKDADTMSALTPAQQQVLDNVRASYLAAWPKVIETLNGGDRARARKERVDIGNIDVHNLSKLYRPHFCGKCNLKLRGWNLYAEHNGGDLLVLDSGTPLPADPPFAAGPASKPAPVKPAPTTTPTVRLVRGGPDSVAASEGAMASIPISYFPAAHIVAASSPLPGTLGPEPDAIKWAHFAPLPTAFGHDAGALADPGVFQIEVVDAEAGEDRVFAALEALAPVYGSSGKPTSWQEFTSPEKEKRTLVVECRALAGQPTRYRSRYLRLVTDEADARALADTRQGLLVTDTADGTGGDADALEILDQKVRATYGEGSRKVTAEAAVGDAGRTRQKIRVFFHLFKQAAVSTGDMERFARRRALRWARRVFASAEMGIRVVGVEHLDWPGRDMLALNGFYADSNLGGMANVKKPSGKNAGSAASKITLTVTVTDPTTSAKATHTIEVPLAAGLDMPAIGAKVVEAVRAKGVGLDAQAFTLPPSDQALERGCDVLLTATGASGKTVQIDAAVHDDAVMEKAHALTIVAPGADEIDDDDMTIGGSPAQRRILRCGASASDRVDVYVVPKMKIAGRAYPAYSTVTNGKFHPDAQLSRAAIMAYAWGGGKFDKRAMDGGDDTPFTLAHEIGHVLADTNHSGAAGEIMHGEACEHSRCDSPKHVFSGPLKVGFSDMNQLDSPKPMPLSNQDMYARMTTAGGPAVTEAWPR